MRIKILSLILLCLMFTSCTSVYTSFETHQSKKETLRRYSNAELELASKEECKKAEQILKEKGLIYYKRYSPYFQVNQYEITDNNEIVMIKNKINNTYLSYDRYVEDFKVSYDGHYLGVCDKGRLHIFDLDKDLYEIEYYKNKKCTKVNFSLDSKYLIINNNNQGQIYDFKSGNLVYDNSNYDIRAGYCRDGNVDSYGFILGYVFTYREIILLDEAKRIIVEGLRKENIIPFTNSYIDSIIFVIKNKENIDVVVKTQHRAWAPFVSFQPTYWLARLQGF